MRADFRRWLILGLPISSILLYYARIIKQAAVIVHVTGLAVDFSLKKNGPVMKLAVYHTKR